MSQTLDLFDFRDEEELRYPNIPGHVGASTSVEAAMHMEASAAALEGRIMAWLRAGNEATSREIGRALGLEWAQITPRTATLHAKGLVEWTGEKRRDPVTGRSGNVIRAKPAEAHA